MENYLYAGIIIFLVVIGFLMLASPTIRRKVKNYFDLNKKV